MSKETEAQEMYTEFIEEICREEGILLESLCQGYVLRLTKCGVSRHIFGAFWDINSAASDRLASDKVACSALLQKSGIPVIPHEILFNPILRKGWAGEKGTWQTALDLFNKFNQKAVLKPNQGTMGLDVYFCETPPALEAACQAIFASHPDAAISPFFEIETEYRLFFLNAPGEKCPLIYGKTRGDGFRHNLSQGAKAFELCNKPSDKKRLDALKTLACQAAETIGINFATIDIAELCGGNLTVMEINSGVQSRFLLEQLPHLRPKVKEMYTRAIRLAFNRRPLSYPI